MSHTPSSIAQLQNVLGLKWNRIFLSRGNKVAVWCWLFISFKCPCHLLPKQFSSTIVTPHFATGSTMTSFCLKQYLPFYNRSTFSAVLASSLYLFVCTELFFMWCWQFSLILNVAVKWGDLLLNIPRGIFLSLWPLLRWMEPFDSGGQKWLSIWKRDEHKDNHANKNNQNTKRRKQHSSVVQL